jgi:hypothetical protein
VAENGRYVDVVSDGWLASSCRLTFLPGNQNPDTICSNAATALLTFSKWKHRKGHSEMSATKNRGHFDFYSKHADTRDPRAAHIEDFAIQKLFFQSTHSPLLNVYWTALNINHAAQKSCVISFLILNTLRAGERASLLFPEMTILQLK